MAKSKGKIGNKNALKHGFYSKTYYTDTKPTGVDQEQALLRDFVRQISSWLKMDKQPSDKQLATFHAMLEAVLNINTCERTILLARGKGGEIGETILEALAAMDPHKLT